MLAKHGLSQVSIKGYLENFRPFWKWLHENGYIDTNPFAYVRIVVDEGPKRDGFTTADLGLLLMAADALERIQICLGLLGCRRGEMFNIQLRDVHLDHTRPHIELIRKTKGDKTWPWGTKNHKTGIVAIPPAMQFDGVVVELVELIRERMADLRFDPEAYLCVPKPYVERMLWIQTQGRLTWDRIKDPMGNFPRSFRHLQRRAGLRKLRRFHELRAAFVTSLFDANVPPARIMKAVRHARIEQTMQYDRKSDLSLVQDVAQIASRAYVST